MKGKLVSVIMVLGLCFLTACGGNSAERTDANVETGTNVDAGTEAEKETAKSDAVAEEGDNAAESDAEETGVYLLSKETIQNEDGEVSGITDYKYDENGNLLEKKAQGTDGSISSEKYEYDEKGNVLVYEENVEVNVDGQVYSEQRRVEYTYDADGVLLSEKSEDGYGFVTSTEYEYGDNGKIAKATISEGIDGIDMITYRTYEYDENDVLRKTVDSDDFGETGVYEEYNEKGDLIKWVGIFGTEATYEYEYDENGNRIKWVGNLGITTTYEYDENGNCIKEADAVQTTTYEYDEHGNTCSASAQR